MSDADSGSESAYPNTVSARLTDETYDKLVAFADEYTGGQITVGAREAIQNGVEEHKQRARELERERDDLARERDRLQEEKNDLRARLEDPDVIDWLEVTRNTSGGLKFGLVGVLVVTVGFGASLVGVWAETVLGASLPEWFLPVTLTGALAGVSVILTTVILGALVGIARRARD
jgi:FtsZ-binding cell division protein ZapB